MTELLLNGVEIRGSELMECEACRAEIESLREVLQVTNRGIEAASPAPEKWAKYSDSLKQKLAQVSPAGVSQVRITHDSWLKRFLHASIRIPVPAGVALLLLFTVSVGMMLQRSSRPTVVEKVSTVQVPVEVPVIQERVVTRVVYRQSNYQSASRRALPRPDNPTVARSQSTPVSLSEFKPLDEVKLTIIKGGSPDEK
jgi:hypothetical protein